MVTFTQLFPHIENKLENKNNHDTYLLLNLFPLYVLNIGHSRGDHIGQVHITFPLHSRCHLSLICLVALFPLSLDVSRAALWWPGGGRGSRLCALVTTLSAHTPLTLLLLTGPGGVPAPGLPGPLPGPGGGGGLGPGWSAPHVSVVWTARRSSPRSSSLVPRPSTTEGRSAPRVARPAPHRPAPPRRHALAVTSHFYTIASFAGRNTADN